MKTLLTRIAALNLALLLALPVSSFAQVVHLCRAEAEQPKPGHACCCPHVEAPAGDALGAECCEFRHTDAGVLSPAPQPVMPDFVPSVVLAHAAPAPLPSDDALLRPRVLVPRGARAPPPPLHGRGVYLEVCSFLI